MCSLPELDIVKLKKNIIRITIRPDRIWPLLWLLLWLIHVKHFLVDLLNLIKIDFHLI